MEFDFILSNTENGPKLDYVKLIDFMRKELEWRQLDYIASLLLEPFPGELAGATYADCDALRLFAELVKQDLPSIGIPDDFPTVIPSATFLDELARIQRLWVIDGSDSCRQIVEAFITEVLDHANDEMLHVLRNVENVATDNNWEYYGHTDILICRSTKRAIDSRNVCLVMMEVSGDWDGAIPELICQVGCWKAQRSDIFDDMPIFAILTNGHSFQFFAMDQSVLYFNGRSLEIPRLNDPLAIEKLGEILRWACWFLHEGTLLACTSILGWNDRPTPDSRDHTERVRPYLRPPLGALSEELRRELSFRQL